MRADGTERRRCARASVAGAAMLVWLCTGGPGARLPAAGPSAGNGPAPAGGAAAQSGGTVAAGGAAAQSGGTVADGVFTADQVARGERTFREVCAACHDTVEFSGGRFRFTWVGLTAGDLFDTIATLMPEGDPGSLSPAQYAAVVAYLLDLNGYPAGETPLPTNLSALQALEIVEAP